MRRDLIIGFIITISIEVLVAWTGNLTHFHPKPRQKDEDIQVNIVMPKIEPDEPEVLEDQPPQPVEIAPIFTQSPGRRTRKPRSTPGCPRPSPTSPRSSRTSRHSPWKSPRRCCR